VYHAPQLVKYMSQGPPGVAQGHAWAGITHDLANLIALAFFVTMNRAFGAGRLGLTVGAFVQAPFRVVHQIHTNSAQTGCVVSMMVFTIYGGHGHQGSVFTFQPAGQYVHKETLARPRSFQTDRGHLRKDQ
jgi:hypothetical protein